MDENGVFTLGDAGGITPEEFKRKRQLVTEPHEVTIADASKVHPEGLKAWQMGDARSFLPEFPRQGCLKLDVLKRHLKLQRVVLEASGWTGASHSIEDAVFV